jgi:peptidyl-prolyl cis-trans isomerase D
MLGFFRKIMQSWAAKAFMALLVVSLSIWGIKDVFHPRLTTAVVSAGSHEIQPADFKRIFQNAVAENAQRNGGQKLTARDAVAQGVDLQLLQAIASDEAVAEMVKRMGVIPSDALIADQIKKQPAFFDRVNGKFDQAAYQQVLQQNGLTPADFEASLRDRIANAHVGAGQAAGLKEPFVYGALLAAYELQNRTISFTLVTPASVPPPALPSDQQLQAFIDQHADDFRRPEMRQLTIVRFSAKALAPTITPDPADLQKRYDQRKERLSTPELRSLAQIPARDAATAQAIVAKLKSGQAPDAVARAFGVQPITYSNTPKANVADAKVADAAFALPPGQPSGPVQTTLAGQAVILVTSVTPAKVPSFAEVRPQLETEARNDMATQKVYDAVKKYDDAHSGGANLADAARAAGATPIQLGPVAANGADMTAKQLPGLDATLLKTAFSLSAGGESDLDDENAGEYYAVRVDKIVPPAVAKLDEIRPMVTQNWMIIEELKRLNAKAGEVADKMKKGGSIEAAAAEVNGKVMHAVAIPRTAIMQNNSLSQELRLKLLGAKAGDVVVGQTAQIPVMVARVDSVAQADPNQAASILVAQRARNSSMMFDAFADVDRRVAKAQIKPQIDVDKARAALGVSPDEAPKSSAPAGGTAPKRAP